LPQDLGNFGMVTYENSWVPRARGVGTQAL
jgi:hypothetical protein